MEKDIGKIKKNPETDIVVRIDDFGGKTGLTIREYVSSEKYTGFTKSGTRIPAESFNEFKKIIDSINPEDFKGENNSQKKLPKSSDENSGIDEENLI
jgi:hypothetical protein